MIVPRRFAECLEVPPAAISDQVSAIAERSGDVLPYVAFLANHNKVDKSYLSIPITCEIVLTA